MTDPATISKESIKTLGPGAYLVTALPSTVLVLTVFALVSSRLIPFVAPTKRHGEEIGRGIPSVLDAAGSLNVAGTVLLVLTVVCVAVLLRPLQISLVQLVEGYWGARAQQSFVHALATERHRRTRDRAMTRQSLRLRVATDADLTELARYAKQQRAVTRLTGRAAAMLGRYPANPDHLMPTVLGNILRRAETTAGERYGLSTVVTYPRLYPHLSSRLDEEISNQLDTLDTTATFVVLFSLQTAVTSVLLLRFDQWALVPMVLLCMTCIAYIGSLRAAARHGELLAVAYDLHRFDLLKAMHLELPNSPAVELENNKVLSLFLEHATGDTPPPVSWRYHHSSSDPDGTAPPPPAASPANDASEA
ncbi:hypothetical protein AB0H83_34985 [Dactylosporangium sp. NPDC050688]|uniref:hypothetical protein n=1 Tax=Dactylosporangium sp. NPDC050688 TaxID=3157217 RepID=UPI0033C13FC4